MKNFTGSSNEIKINLLILNLSLKYWLEGGNEFAGYPYQLIVRLSTREIYVGF